MPRPINLNSPLGRKRAALGLTAEEFGRRVGCSKVTVQHIECGARPLTAKLAAKIDQLAGDGEIVYDEITACACQCVLAVEKYKKAAWSIVADLIRQQLARELTRRQ